jgi:tetratricopeptide (TPR) repeat protein
MLFRLAVITLIGGILIAVAVLDTVAPAPASCGQADEHLGARELKLAEEAYSAALKDDSEADCAIAGLRKTQCRRARRALESANLPGEAEKKYLAVLKEHPRSSCAAKGLSEIADRRCDQAKELLEKPALHDEAIKAYTALLAVEPRPDCVPGDLKAAVALKKQAEKGQTGDPPPQVSACCCCDQCGQPPEGGGRCDR